jgi:hypothetical protein
MDAVRGGEGVEGKVLGFGFWGGRAERIRMERFRTTMQTIVCGSN